jgi:hypothetical protein
MLATRKLRLKFIFILRHYAAEWMSALRNGMRNNCLFGTYRASSTRNYSSPMSSEYPATIRIDNDAGRIAFLSPRGSRFESPSATINQMLSSAPQTSARRRV